MFDKIQNPKTGRWVKTNSLLGKKIISKYSEQVGGWWGCVKPKLTKEQISSWDAKERSKLCKRNEGRPVGRYATRQPCVTAVVENPSICNSPQEQQEMDLAQQVKAQAEQSYAAAQGAQSKASSVPQPSAAAAAQPVPPSYEQLFHISNHWWIHMNKGLNTHFHGKPQESVPSHGDFDPIPRKNSLIGALHYHFRNGDIRRLGALFITELYRDGANIINFYSDITHLRPDDVIVYYIIKKNPRSKYLVHRHFNAFAIDKSVTSIVIEPKKQQHFVPHQPNQNLFGQHNVKNFGGPFPDPRKVKLEDWP